MANREPIVETYRGVVYPQSLDHMGHMNVAFYVSKFDEATWNFLHLIGITRQFMQETNSGMVAVEQRISYQREVFAGEILSISTQVVEYSTKKIVFCHNMVNGQLELVSSTTITGVHLDKLLRKSKSFPESILANLADALSSQEQPA